MPPELTKRQLKRRQDNLAALDRKAKATFLRVFKDKAKKTKLSADATTHMLIKLHQLWDLI